LKGWGQDVADRDGKSKAGLGLEKEYKGTAVHNEDRYKKPAPKESNCGRSPACKNKTESREKRQMKGRKSHDAEQ